METEGLDKILASEPETPVETPAAEPETLAEQVARERDERGRFVAKDEGGEATPAQETAPAAPPAADLPTVPRAALEDERRKRQEVERALREMEQRYQSQPQPETEAPDFWEDPNAVIGKQVNQAVEQALQGWEMKRMQAEADNAEAAAKAKYPDYDDAFAKFREQVGYNPALLQELQRAPDKAEFAYRRGKQALDLAQVGDLDALTAKIRAEARAEVEAELRTQTPLAIPTTTAGQRSVGDRGGPAWAGPQSLANIIGG